MKGLRPLQASEVGLYRRRRVEFEWAERARCLGEGRGRGAGRPGRVDFPQAASRCLAPALPSRAAPVDVPSLLELTRSPPIVRLSTTFSARSLVCPRRSPLPDPLPLLDRWKRTHRSRPFGRGPPTEAKSISRDRGLPSTPSPFRLALPSSPSLPAHLQPASPLPNSQAGRSSSLPVLSLLSLARSLPGFA
jgi:hypothetical protein